MPVTPEDTKACIVLLLSTCPHPCRLRKLLRDYRRLKGHNMPLFGFENHLELLKSFIDIIMVLDCGHERNPEIRLIRRDTQYARTRDSLSGFSDDRGRLNGQRLHYVAQPVSPILQDEAAAYYMPPEVPPNRENFVLIDDGIGEGREEEEHLESIWDGETDLSTSFFIRLFMRWMMDFIRIIWRKFVQAIGWSTNTN